MVADLRKMQENQWVSEIQIDKPEFVEFLLIRHKCKVHQRADNAVSNFIGMDGIHFFKIIEFPFSIIVL